MSEHPLRDLARRIRAVAAEHEAYSQASAIVQNCVDHLSAVARTHEANTQLELANRRVADLEKQLNTKIKNDVNATSL